MRTARGGMSVMIVGAGRAGLALARNFHGRGIDVTGVVSRSRKSASRASRLLGRGRGSTRLEPAYLRAEALVLCVPDRDIESVARKLARHELRGKVVLHTSGCQDTGPLAPARKAGAATGCLHPLTSFPPPSAPPPDLKGVAFAVEGDPAALRAARRLARSVGGKPVTIPAGKRGAYHLVASLSANGLVALLDTAFEIARRELRWSERSVREAFIPLVLAAAGNVAQVGSRRALTGPVARGDRQTVRRHREVLSTGAAPARDLYLLLARRAVEMALREGMLTTKEASMMRRVLSSEGD